MGSETVDHVLAAVRDTLAARTGRGSSYIIAPSGAGSDGQPRAGMTALSDMVFDLDERRMAMWSVFASNSPADVADATPAADRVSDVVPGVVDDEAIYAGGFGEDNEWIAVPGSGLPGSQLGLLFWLLGAVVAEPADQVATDLGSYDEHGRPDGFHYRVEVDPARAVQRADLRDRESLAAGFAEAGVDVDADRLTLLVTIDDQRLIRDIDTSLSAPADDPIGLTRLRLELRDLGLPVSIKLPDHPYRMTVEEFVRAMVPEPDVEKFRRWFTP